VLKDELVQVDPSDLREPSDLRDHPEPADPRDLPELPDPRETAVQLVRPDLPDLLRRTTPKSSLSSSVSPDHSWEDRVVDVAPPPR